MSSPRARVATFAAVTAVVAVTTTGYAVHELQQSRETRSAAPTVPSVQPSSLAASLTGDYVAFRHTGLDSEYGVVAVVPLDDPDGPRAFTGAVCDRVYAAPTGASCLATERGVVTTYSASTLGPDWKPVEQQPLAGLPSRTRMSADGALVASTSFVAGHDYMSVGFSTATEIHALDGTDYGNLEDFQLVVDGTDVAPKDRNVWGVTFAGDDETFYATVGTRGHTYLVRGDLSDRTLTTVADHVECPSLSPDGTRIAFKEAGTVGGQPGWTPAVLDLATGKRTVLDGETRNVDDQIEWLDDDTILYGLARTDEPGVTDVWSLDTTAAARPELFIEQAWSPTVVH
jgi:hypothetical protein